VIAGEASYDSSRVLGLATASGWPLLATALSGARDGGAITTYHHLLSRGVPESLRPEVVVAIGAIGPSPRLEDLVASASSRFRVDPGGRTIDPRRNATRIAHADPVALLETIEPVASTGFREAWQAGDQQARNNLDGYLASESVMSGASAARALGETGWEILVAASSLPIREVDAHVDKPGLVIGNRGASGIDGFVSTSLGASSTGRRTISLAGDLSLLHDSNGFLCEPGGDLVIVVLDNNGGGLFDSLPQASHAPGFERLFITPHGRKIGVLAELHSLGFAEASTSSSLRSQIDERLERGGVHILRVEIDRHHDLAVRRAMDELGAQSASSGEL
jgi:2-succinyl-5-enolpyruvyl-6-hydroxy-3-cyclohexene-1-carboxylate synthase